MFVIELKYLWDVIKSIRFRSKCFQINKRYRRDKYSKPLKIYQGSIQLQTGKKGKK